MYVYIFILDSMTSLLIPKLLEESSALPGLHLLASDLRQITRLDLREGGIL